LSHNAEYYYISTRC